MSRKTNDDYVRVPLSSELEMNNESDSDINSPINDMNNGEVIRDSPSLWNFDFYQQFFDVDTSQVLRRLAFAVLPNPRSNFTQHVLRPKADLYGPFWIATTLILAAAIGGNVSSFLKSQGEVTSWRYDFGKVTLASTVIYVYWWLVPLAIVTFSYIRARTTSVTQNDDQDPLVDSNPRSSRRINEGSIEKSGFVELLSLYGYSLAIFVPVSVLWIIPSTILQWILAVVAMGVSGAFLAFALLPFFRRQQKQLAEPLVIGLLVLHCLFSMGLMMTFFYGSSASSVLPSVVEPQVAPVDSNVLAAGAKSEAEAAPKLPEKKRDVQNRPMTEKVQKQVDPVDASSKKRTTASP